MTPATKQQKHYHSHYLLVILALVLASQFIANTLSANTPAANALHDHEQIRHTAIEFVRSQIPEDVHIKNISAGKMDNRIRFKQCSLPLEASSTSKKTIAKNWTIAIHCFDIPAWSIYIPVKTTLTRKMLVSKITITRGETLTTKNIKLVEQDISHQNQNHFSDITHVNGHEARRTIRPGRVIKSNMLQEALMVHKKETVLIYARNQKLKISMKGTALKNGRYNEMIKVRNNSSKKIIEALVIDRGVVAVNF